MFEGLNIVSVKIKQLRPVILQKQHINDFENIKDFVRNRARFTINFKRINKFYSEGFVHCEFHRDHRTNDFYVTLYKNEYSSTRKISNKNKNENKKENEGKTKTSSGAVVFDKASDVLFNDQDSFLLVEQENRGNESIRFRLKKIDNLSNGIIPQDPEISYCAPTIAERDQELYEARELSRQNKSGFNAYRAVVDNLTEQNKKRYSHVIEQQCLIDQQLDHIFSVKHGFDEELPPQIIAHWTNLRYIPSKENSSKGSRSDVSKNKLCQQFIMKEGIDVYNKLIKNYTSL